ncbi:MAG: cobalamin-binding protein [Mariprofundus sp.]|nr:cobalamin-binding protein [Mariprofundus sp.]
MKYFRLCCTVLCLWPGMLSAAPLERILALTPHACEMLYAIGASANIVGAVDYCDYPESATHLPRVGGYTGINVEAALRLHPDAAIVMNRNVKGITQLEKMGVKIISSNPVDFEAVFQDILRMGALTGHELKAKALVHKQRLSLERIRHFSNQFGADKIRVFYELWHDPIMTAGGPSFITALIKEAGGYNIFADVGLETPHVNVEAVIRAHPDIIIIPLEKRNLKERQVFWEHWLGKGNVRFAAINPDLLHRPGPRLIEGLELLQQALHDSSVLVQSRP